MCHRATYVVPPELFESKSFISDGFPKLLHQSWKTSSLPQEFAVSRKTCLDANPQHRSILWTDRMNRDFIRSHYPWFLETFDAYNSNIKRADAVRYFYMYHFGGVYSDLDVKCIRGFDALAPLANISEVVLGRKGNIGSRQSIPNAIIMSKPRSVFWLHVIREMARRVNCSTPMYDTGPELLHQVYATDATALVVLLPSASMYPLDWETRTVQRVTHSNREKKWRDHNFSDYSVAHTYWRHSWKA